LLSASTTRAWKEGASRFAWCRRSSRKSISTSSILPSANSSFRRTATSRSSMAPSASRKALAVFFQSATLSLPLRGHQLVVQRQELGADGVGQVPKLLEPVLLGGVDLAVGQDEGPNPPHLLGADVAVGQDDGAHRLEEQLVEGGDARLRL